MNRKISKQRYLSKYGNRFFEDFERLFTHQFWNLVDIAKKYRFSRERARQIFKLLYDRNYQQIKISKRLKRLTDKKECILFFDPRFEQVFQKIAELGFRVEKVSAQKIKVNGHSVRFSKPLPWEYVKGVLYKRYLLHPDFDFAILSFNSQFYVVPRGEFRSVMNSGYQRVHLYMRQSPYNKTKKTNRGTNKRNFSQYQEA